MHLGTGAHIRVTGKGRKEAATPLTGETVNVLRAWLNERRGRPEDPLFPTRQRTTAQPLTQSARSSQSTPPQPQPTARRCRPRHVTPHTLRHYVDGWVMWPAGVFPLAGAPRGPVPAT